MCLMHEKSIPLCTVRVYVVMRFIAFHSSFHVRVQDLRQNCIKMYLVIPNLTRQTCLDSGSSLDSRFPSSSAGKRENDKIDFTQQNCGE